jgi:CDGSH-type Zn-finger protein
MADPAIAAKTPEVMELDPGTYFWCRCGRTRTRPWCDGSHAGTEFEPLEFEVDAKKKLALCRCRRTAKPPFCDGTHKKLP